MSAKVNLFVVFVGVLMLSFSCSIGETRREKIDGFTRVYTPHKILGVTYNVAVEDVKTLKERKEDAEMVALKRKYAIEARRADIALWLGGLMMAAALACAVYAYLRKGFIKYGGLAAWCAVLGGMCWGFVELIDYLKWMVLASFVAAIGLFLYEHREFDLGEWLKERNK